MKRCVIIGAAPVADITYMQAYLSQDDYVIVADGGNKAAKALGICPHLTVADYDSSVRPEKDKNQVILPVEKDDTDTAAAMQIAFDQGYREFVLLGCLGGRFDHSIANVINARRFTEKGARVTLVDDKNEITVLLPGTHLLKPGGFSVFALSETVKGLTITDAKYPIHDFLLQSDNPLCVSNCALSSKAQVSFHEGALLLVFAKD